MSNSEFESCIKTPMLKISRTGLQIREIESRIIVSSEHLESAVEIFKEHRSDTQDLGVK